MPAVHDSLPPSARLPSPLTMRARLRAALPQFGSIEWSARTGSTNADLLVRARNGDIATRPWLLGTHLQSEGHGRAGRPWHNERGATLMFSCAFDVHLVGRQLPTLAPWIGTVTCETLRARLDPTRRHRLTMKWPNDLLWDHAKLAGLLIEGAQSGKGVRPDDGTRPGKATADRPDTADAGRRLIVIGLGLNLAGGDALSRSLDRPVADWTAVTAADPRARKDSPPALVACLAQAWGDAIERATVTGFADLPQRYEHVDALKDQTLNILHDGRVLQTGTGYGVDSDGRLLIRTVLGVQPISVGEVSVRIPT